MRFRAKTLSFLSTVQLSVPVLALHSFSFYSRFLARKMSILSPRLENMTISSDKENQWSGSKLVQEHNSKKTTPTKVEVSHACMTSIGQLVVLIKWFRFLCRNTQRVLSRVSRCSGRILIGSCCSRFSTMTSGKCIRRLRLPFGLLRKWISPRLCSDVNFTLSRVLIMSYVTGSEGLGVSAS